MPTKVYRYQNAGGEGPYTSDWYYRAELLVDHGNYWREHPGPYDDFYSKPLPTFRYAFSSKANAMEWFEGWHDKLHASGFSLCEIEADHVVISKSGRQVVFCMEKDVDYSTYKYLQEVLLCYKMSNR